MPARKRTKPASDVGGRAMPERDDPQYREIIARLIAIQDAAVAGPRMDTPPDKIPLIDPTANVLQLVAKETQRQDDLRQADARRQDDLGKIRSSHIREIDAIRSKAQRDLANAETKRVNALALAERLRLDALLVQQKADVALANEKTGATAATLAQQVLTVAEAMRQQVAMTTAASATQMDTMRKTFDDRVTMLERARYEGGGRDEQRTEGRQGNQWVIGLVVAIIAIVVSAAISVSVANLGHH